MFLTTTFVNLSDFNDYCGIVKLGNAASSGYYTHAPHLTGETVLPCETKRSKFELKLDIAKCYRKVR